MMQTLRLFLLTVLLSPACIFGRAPDNGTSMWYRQKLYTDLLKDYVSALRPAANVSHSIPVHVDSFRFWSVNELDEQQQIMSSVAFLRLTWNDFRLTWNPKDYGELDELEIPLKELWYPDAYVDNVKESSVALTTHHFAVVYSDGRVKWEQIMHLRTYCKIDLTYFPYDSHNCSLWLSFWTYDKSKAHLVLHRDDSGYCTYITPHDWSYTHCDLQEAEFTDVYGESDPQNVTYPMINYWLVLERASAFTNHLFVAPGVSLCLITPAIFLLPPASKEKIIFGSGVLVSNVLLLGELIRFIPAAYPTLPFIGKYILSNIVLCCLSLLVSTCIINIWGKRSTSTSAPPQFVITIFLGPLARWLHVTADHFAESLEGTDHAAAKDSSVRMSNTTHTENLQFSDGVFGEGAAHTLPAHHTYAWRIARIQWHQLAVVLERIFLVLYLGVLTLLTLAFTIYI